ncbi:MAG: serine/threonine-protein kinase [bacterium]|nr:serine/threonine-protein kinase [bacterium]
MALRSLKNFNVVRLIKSNPYSQIFEIKDKVSQIHYVLKKIKKEPLSNYDQKAILERCEKLKRITNNNIVTLYDYFDMKGYIYTVTEYIEGESLSNLILYRKYSEKFSISLYVKFLIHICDGLLALNENGIVHGDVKTGNIFYTPKNEIKILDVILGFLSKNRIEKMNLFDKILFWLGIKKDLLVIQGTLTYTAPELIFGLEADQQSDIYSFGIMSYVLLTGELPMSGETLNDQNLMKLWHLNPKKIPVFPQEIKDDIPTDLENIILKSITPDKRDRFQNFFEIKDKLISVLKEIESGRIL